MISKLLQLCRHQNHTTNKPAHLNCSSTCSVFDLLADDMINEIASHLGMISFARFSSTNRIIRNALSTKRAPQLSFLRSIKSGKIPSQAISYAVSVNDIELLTYLSRGGVDLQVLDVGLKEAAKHENMEMIQWFIDKGSNNWKLGLKGASYSGNMKLVLFFVEQGADNICDSAWTAAIHGHKHLVEYFIEKNIVAKYNALEGASEGGHIDIIKHVLEKGARSKHALVHAASKQPHRKDIIKLLLESHPQDDKTIAFNMVCARTDAELVELFLKTGVEKDIDKGLITAVLNRRYEIAKKLVLHGGDPNQALQEAAQHAPEDFIRFLIEKGATNMQDVVTQACNNPNDNVPKLLMQYGKPKWNEALIPAIQNRKIDLVHTLIDKGANNWNVALHRAAEVGDEYLVKLFIEKGATKWSQALMRAVENGHKDIVQLFIQRGAVASDLQQAYKEAENYGKNQEIIELLKPYAQ